jgi:hypothetical protein
LAIFFFKICPSNSCLTFLSCLFSVVIFIIFLLLMNVTKWVHAIITLLNYLTLTC